MPPAHMRWSMKTGDYVQIVPGIHDQSMPSDGSKNGLVVEVVGPHHDQAVVMFHNGAILKFHKSQILICKSLSNRL